MSSASGSKLYIGNENFRSVCWLYGNQVEEFLLFYDHTKIFLNISASPLVLEDIVYAQSVRKEQY